MQQSHEENWSILHDSETFFGAEHNRGGNNMEILTASEVAAILRISKRQVYELARETENPIPSIRIRTSVRFRRSDVDGWVAGLVQNNAA
jgi:excisionase family DNA binding protein